jgi:ABC-2 type transport system ATP-binding protein
MEKGQVPGEKPSTSGAPTLKPYSNSRTYNQSESVILHPQMTKVVLEVESIDKQFAQVNAIDHLSFDVQAGEFFALLGPNGAGKTTTVRMLMGIIHADNGEIRYSISGPQQWPSASELGYLPEERGLYKDTPVLRTLVYMATLRGMRQQQAGAAAMHWLERLGLMDRAREKLDALSKGNQQKIQFISAVLHRPKFLILDEPFSGLDPINQELFSDLIRKIRDEGATILLSAHQMQLVERIADRLLLMNQGRSVLHGSLEEIRKSARWTNRLVLRTTKEKPDLSVFEGVTGIESARQTAPFEVSLLVGQGSSLSELLVAAGSAMEIVDIHNERISLHEIYVQALGEDMSLNENLLKESVEVSA